MAERGGLSGTEVDGVFFTEGRLLDLRSQGHVHVEISRQNSNLAEIKQEMARRAVRLGGNAIVGFTYGQRAHGWLKLLSFSWDTESWYGDGEAVSLP